MIQDQQVKNDYPLRYGPYGGRYVPELLMKPLCDLEAAFKYWSGIDHFREELGNILSSYAGRPTPLTEVPRYATAVGRARIFLKREDLLHTGAHKLNNALGQALLARRMGKRRVIAETGAGQHGVATATAAARLGLECVVFMGEVDARRQALNVYRMRLLGAEVRTVETGSATLKDAVNEAMREWVRSVDDSGYILGSALGPHPYPAMVKFFQSIIGTETREQCRRVVGHLPDVIVACVGGGSNAIGMFSGFLEEADVRLVGIEAGGRGTAPGDHAARFAGGLPGVLHGMHTYLLQDEWGQVLPTHSISAGLDYPAIGPELAWLKESGRVEFSTAGDEEALREFHRLAELEGIIPALESSHALAGAVRISPEMQDGQIILVNLSGRGDKDVRSVADHEGGLS